jgi:hypothetical protein
VSATPVSGPDVQGPDDRPGGAVFWVGLVIGGAVMAFGIRGVFEDSRATHPTTLVAWVVGADLAHDLLLVPIVLAIASVVMRATSDRWRPFLRIGLVATGVVLLIGYVPWRGYGRGNVPDNPSVQPLDYTSAILTVLAFVWVGVALAASTSAWRAARGRRASRREPG